jgi:phospholipase D1/2
MAAQYRTINRGGHSIYEEIRKAGYEPYVPHQLKVFHQANLLAFSRMDYIRFYHLRAYDRINAPFRA